MTDRMHINWDIIVRRILDQADETERELVERWLTEDEMNREYYRKAKRYFDRYYTGEESREVDIDHIYLPKASEREIVIDRLYKLSRMRGVNLSFTRINLRGSTFGDGL